MPKADGCVEEADVDAGPAAAAGISIGGGRGRENEVSVVVSGEAFDVNKGESGASSGTSEGA